MKSLKIIAASIAVLGLVTCGANEKTPATSKPNVNMSAQTAKNTSNKDQFTYANYDKVRMNHLALDLDVDFDRKVLDGTATITFEKLDPSANELVLDTKDLKIKSVEILQNGSWMDAKYAQSDDDEVMGQSLTILLLDKADKVRIGYETGPEAEGLQWLSPAQTAGKKHPFLFSQAQAINARTMTPIQDTPAIRITYTANLRTPPELLALMSANQDPDTPRDGDYSFEMPQPIPPYLLAIAVGDIKFKPINDHIGVYAEAYILDKAAEEFSETPLMEEANEALYGPYRWGRYDMIVLPPSFPYGGMENPRLSFLTPTLVAGDKSLTNVVAHELAHSWSGNLVTNSNWRDSWLNEGFTSYVENRVMEELYGKERATMEQALDMDGLIRGISEAKDPALTHLKMPDNMKHPDDAFSSIAYIKGANFLFFLEDRFGREHFDPFLKQYFDDYAFKTATTEAFLTYLGENLRKQFPDAVTDAEIKAWVYEPGLPETARKPKSDAFSKVEKQSADWISGKISIEQMNTSAWTTHEWLHFLNNLPLNTTPQQLGRLDKAFSLTGHSNAEIAFAWYMQTIQVGYKPAVPALREFLMNVGRGKFIYRLYGALKANNRVDWAEKVYEQARPGYHPIAQRRIDAILKD
ncbi:MAG: M1 family metallopeptidase [Hellea sp.]|nr:M1 family metallopeptidase [Hellea sp.]